VRAAAILIAAALAAGGCISYKSGLDLPDPGRLQCGVTTRCEVYERFGLPDTIRRRAEGLVLTYEVGGGRGYSVGAGWQVVSFTTTETRFSRRSLEIVLDPADLVTTARWTDGAGRTRDLAGE